MDEFIVKVLIDKFFYDQEFINNKIKELTATKTNVKVLSNKPLVLKDFPTEHSILVDMTGNIIFFWDGKESLGEHQARSAKQNGANIRVVRYDKHPLKAWIGVEWKFPSRRYKSYEGKEFKNWWHLQNWMDKCKGNITGIDYRLQKIKTNETQSN